MNVDGTWSNFLKNPSIFRGFDHIDQPSFKSPIKGRIYKIFGNTSCCTDNFIYLISYEVCSKQYIGETDDIRRRINNQLSTIKTPKKSRSSSGNILMRVTWPQMQRYDSSGYWPQSSLDRRGEKKTRKSSGCTNSNNSDQLAWTSKLTSLK